eukprot:Gb_29647 [translate_table: standard]
MVAFPSRGFLLLLPIKILRFWHCGLKIWNPCDKSGLSNTKTMCEAFPARRLWSGRHTHHKQGEKMVGRSISARVQGFESVNANPQFERQTSAYSSSSSADQIAPMGTHWASRDQTCHSNPCGRRTAIWLQERQTEMAVGNAGTKVVKGSKWKQIVKKLKGYVRTRGNHSGPLQRLQYACQSYVKGFDGHVKRSMNGPPATVCPVKTAGSASASEAPVKRIPIWQRRNSAPISPLAIPKKPPSRSRNTHLSII